MKNYKINHQKAWLYFIELGLLPIDAKKNEWCLHHTDINLKYTDPQRYEEWRVDDLVPMLKTEHTRLHSTNRHHTEETKSKIRETLQGHEVSEETRKKISEKCRGKQSWLKGTHGLIESPMKGKHHSEESRKKMSEALKGRKQTKAEKDKRTKSLTKAWADEKLRMKQSKRVANLIWITDGKTNKRIDKSCAIPVGWRHGKTSRKLYN